MPNWDTSQVTNLRKHSKVKEISMPILPLGHNEVTNMDRMFRGVLRSTKILGIGTRRSDEYVLDVLWRIFVQPRYWELKNKHAALGIGSEEYELLAHPRSIKTLRSIFVQ